MTTPLGAIEIGPREGRRVTIARTTAETEITVTLGLDGAGHTGIDTGIGFYDHLLGSLAHHGLFDLAIQADGDLQIDEHHTVEDVALVLGAAFAEALGDRAGIARFGASSVPMDESIATAVIDIGGRPYAVIDLPFRGERAGGLPLQLVEHALEAFARTAGRDAPPLGHGPQRPPPRRGRVQGARACPARGLRDRPAARGRGVHQGRPRMTARPRIAVVDYGAGNLVSIDQALTTVGADVELVRDREAMRGADALIVPGVGAAQPAMARLESHGLVEPIRAWLAADRPFLGICLGLQLLFDGSDEDGATTLGVVPGRTVRLDDAPTLPHIGWNQVERTRAHPLFDGIAEGADFYFVHSYAGAPSEAGAGGGRPRARHDRARRALHLGGRARLAARRPVPPGAEWSRRPPPAGQLRRPRAGRLMLRRRVIPCLDVADGRVVKGTRFVDLVDEGDPPELAERYANEGADELVFLDITAAPERRGTLLDIVERTARRAFIPLTVGGGVRSVSEMRDVLRAGADKVSLNTAAVADPTLISRCAARFGRQAVVVAIDARVVAVAGAAAQSRSAPSPARRAPRAPIRPHHLGSRRQGRPRADRCRCGRLGEARRRTRGRRTARHLDRS